MICSGLRSRLFPCPYYGFIPPLIQVDLMGKLCRWNGTLKGMYGYQQFCLKLEGGWGAGYVKVLFSTNCPKLHCFGRFSGARAHHQGLRWLKPCHWFQRDVYWHCEFAKLRPAAQFQLLTVVVHWQGAGAHYPERVTPIQPLWNGVFTSWFIFR